MARDNTTTIRGNLTRDPELTYSQSGTAICRFGLAWNQYNPNGEDQVHFFDVTSFKGLAENVAESLSKGDRVTVDGRLDFSQWKVKDDDGNETDVNRSKVSILADDVAPSLMWATADITKNPKADSDRQQGPVPTGDAPTSDAEPF